jgi:hypothetical protein
MPQAFVIAFRKVQVYYQQHPSIPWTSDLDSATTFPTPQDAIARAHVELGLEDEDFDVVPVTVLEPALRRQYQQYVDNFPLIDPRD